MYFASRYHIIIINIGWSHEEDSAPCFHLIRFRPLPIPADISDNVNTENRTGSAQTPLLRFVVDLLHNKLYKKIHNKSPLSYSVLGVHVVRILMPQVSLMVPAVHTPPVQKRRQSGVCFQPARPLGRRHDDGYQFAGTRRLERGARSWKHDHKWRGRKRRWVVHFSAGLVIALRIMS